MSAEKKPNLIFFIPDQWRGDMLGHLGNRAAQTPVLDQLVETEAISFSQTFCQNPVCTPSRCSFMTGWYPHVRGHRSMQHLLHPGEPCLLKELKKAGYFVYWGGKNDLVTDPLASCDYRHQVKPTHPNLHADTSWRDEDAYSFMAGRLKKEINESVYLDSDWAHVLDAISFAQNYDGEKPLCLFLTLEYPHPPYGVEEPYFSAIDREQLPPRIRAEDLASGKARLLEEVRKRQALSHWSEEQWNELRATYYGMAMRTDDALGRLINTFKATGSWDDTALFFFSDHGDYTGDYGLVEKAQNTFEDCLTHVPFVFKPPQSHPRTSGIRSALVELIDFPATVYDLIGWQPEYTLFGKSLLPLLSRDTPHRDAVFCEGGRLPTEGHCSEGTPQADKDSLYWPRVHVQASDAQAHGKAIMCRTERYKYVFRKEEADEFYDLKDDPGETKNRIDDPSLHAIATGMKERLLDHYLETADIVPWERDPRDSQ